MRVNPRVLALLVCPKCAGPLQDPDSVHARHLCCAACGHAVQTKDGVPRFAGEADGTIARRTQASFGYEWTHFNDWRESGATNFEDYFVGIDLASLSQSVVLDAGCGMGRHARQIAPFAGDVLALDFSAAIEQAARNTADLGNVSCVQADLFELPIREASIDFAYSLGVLHHVERTEAALAGLVKSLKPGGRLRVYLYWRKHGISGALLRLATAARLLTIRMPFPVLRSLCWLLSAGLWPAVIQPYRLLSSLGIRWHESWPLFVYTRYPFAVLYNDQFDRFSAPLEKRYDANEVEQLLRSAGLVDVSVRTCFGWIGDGRKPA